MTLRFAFLVLEEHPYGREMLRILLQQGVQPGLIVAERSAVAEEERAKYLNRIAGQPMPPPMEDLHLAAIPIENVASHNSTACQALLNEFAPDLLVLGGTRILRPPILACPPQGTVNAHPALLPWVRGSSSVAWSLYKNLPVGSTVHFVDDGIDTGPIILRRHLPVTRGESYEQIVRRILSLSGTLMAQALALLASGEVEAVPQALQVGETFRVIPDDLFKIAKSRLTDGSYRHFVDRQDGT